MPLRKLLVEMELKFDVENVLSMNGGEGELSYAKNSRPQENCLRLLQPSLEECIREMRLIPCESFCIADMGCSVGPNTLFVAETISNAVQKKYSSPSHQMPDLHMFFSDLPSNDFNLLLQQIHNNNGTSTPCRYYAAAVAGSFHRRLFPKRSLHFVHTSCSLHWLSRVPPEIEDQNSTCWNGGGVFIAKEGPAEVARAYLRQFQEDIGRFLRARREEVVEGGRMFAFMAGREGCDPTDQGGLSLLADMLNAALDDVIALGDHLIDRRTIQNFNLPFFAPSVDEVRSEVEKEGSFRVINIEFVKQEVKSEVMGMEDKDGGFGMMVADNARAVFEPLLASHFGEDVMDAVFERYAVKAEEKLPSPSTYRSRVEGIVAVLERST